MSVRARALLVAAGALILFDAASTLCAAPKFLGPNKCASCHEHEKQKQWADKDTHAKALSQLEDKNAAKYAKAIGVADPYDLKGSCVSCHATVFNGDANAGVSCETCHGAGSDYVEPHQQKGAYAKAVTLGMIDTRGNLTVWAKMCVDCHVLRDAKLIAAGHKSGADFDVGSSSQKIVHWAQSYDYAKLSAAGKAGGGRPAAAAPPKPAPAPAPTSPPAAAPTPAPTKLAPAATRAPTIAPAAAAPRATAAPTAVQEAPTAVPRPAPPAPEKRASSPAPPTQAKPTPRAGEIAIEIQATPIPTLTPRRVAPGSAGGRSVAPPPPPRGSPRPAPRIKPKPRPRRTPAAVVAPAPMPTRTPTRRPAPQLPPQRAPH